METKQKRNDWGELAVGRITMGLTGFGSRFRIGLAVDLMSHI